MTRSLRQDVSYPTEHCAGRHTYTSVCACSWKLSYSVKFQYLDDRPNVPFSKLNLYVCDTRY